MLQSKIQLKGRVEWKLTDIKSGKIISGKIDNLITSSARENLASLAIGETVSNLPNYIGLGTGEEITSDAISGLITPIQYDGANYNKMCGVRNKLGLYSARYIASFVPSEAIGTIREIGLFSGPNQDDELWARVTVNIYKTATQRLSVYWYFDFSPTELITVRGSSLSIQEALTAWIANQTYPYTFSSASVVALLQWNHASEIKIRLNASVSNTKYDLILGGDFSRKVKVLNNFRVTGVSILPNQNVSLNDIKRNLVIRGWEE